MRASLEAVTRRHQTTTGGEAISRHRYDVQLEVVLTNKGKQQAIIDMSGFTLGISHCRPRLRRRKRTPEANLTQQIPGEIRLNPKGEAKTVALRFQSPMVAGYVTEAQFFPDASLNGNSRHEFVLSGLHEGRIFASHRGHLRAGSIKLVDFPQ